MLDGLVSWSTGDESYLGDRSSAFALSIDRAARQMTITAAFAEK